MSWGGIIPWEVIECERTCHDREPGTGYVIHVPGCTIGDKIRPRGGKPPPPAAPAEDPQTLGHVPVPEPNVS